MNTETLEELDIPRLVEETVSRLKHQRDEKLKKDSEERERQAAESARLMALVKEKLDNINAQLKRIVEQAPELRRLLSLSRLRASPWRQEWLKTPHSQVIAFPDNLYASPPRIISWCLVTVLAEDDLDCKIVLAHHYDSTNTWSDVSECDYCYVTAKKLEMLDRLSEPRKLIEKVVSLTL